MRATTIGCLVAACALFLGCDDASGTSGDYHGGGHYEPGPPPSGGGTPGGSGAPGGGAPGGDGNLGATPGGAQDIGYARELIAGGQVPDASAFLVEGLLSEHDLPVEGPPCERFLCVRPAVGVAPDPETGEPTHWAHFGMTSGFRADRFVRPPMDAVVVVDRSASMSGDMAETNTAVAAFVAQMGPDDRLAVLAVNDTIETLHPLRAVADVDPLIDRIHGIRAQGGWAIEAGIDDAIRRLQGVRNDPNRLRRIVVLSCGMPGSGPGAPFATAVERAADHRIGVSFFGVLLGFDAGVAGLLGRTEGGAFGYLQSLEAIERVFDTDFDYMMTPLAYDLSFRIAVAEGFEIDALYGLPGEPDAEGRPGFEVATAFLSRGKGAIVARLAKTGPHDGELGRAHLSYRPETALGWDGPVDDAVPLPVTDDAETRYDGYGVRKAVALVTLATGAAQATTDWHAGDTVLAVARMDALVAHLDAEVDALNDPALAEEVELMRRLRQNME